MGVFKDIFEMLRGMTITSKHLLRHAVTVQYPEQKDVISERFRGIVVLLSDKETGEPNCTSCMLCMRACPSAAIKIVSPRGEDKKRHLEKFEVDNTLCCYCGLCEEACNFAAIKMATYYELSTPKKEDLIWDMKKLLEMGKDVPYTPRPKRKPKPKPAPPAPSATPADAKPAEPVQPEVPVQPAEPKASESAPATPDKPDDTKPEEGSSQNG